ncbi:MAG: aromatic ring-hydroxylating dioxygenase subunit alpha [bacterium]|nr:aromatic ring-hydroxylating dioxygenase subunit alpha [Gammaproteobacteria bacterium]HIL98539.1 aromatic ring-hydroxylating dioxygenase subunit alpha [Pseudomonadales bacterium]
MKFIATDVEDNPARVDANVLEQKQKPGFSMGNYFYRSHVVYERELDRLFYKSWLYAGHVSQIPNPGDFFLYEIGEDSIILSRDNDGNVHASMNICRHRGARVCEEQTGNKKTFVCPYHGWVYNLDGTLRAARHMEMQESFSQDQYGLKSVRMVEYEGCLFINCDSEAADFVPSLDRIAPALKPYDLSNAKVAHSQVYKVDANWKLALENYLECYHCATSHRAYAKLHTLQARDEHVEKINQAMWDRSEEQTGVANISHDHYSAYSSEVDGFGTSVYTSRYALYDGFKTGSEGGVPVAPLMGEFKGFDGGCGDFQIGITTFMLNYPDHCVLYRFTPRGMTQTDMEIVWFVRRDAEEGVDYDKDKVIWLWHNTTLEDEYIILRNSEGVNSRFFEPGPYHPEFESCCLDFVDWYLSSMGSVDSQSCE